MGTPDKMMQGAPPRETYLVTPREMSVTPREMTMFGPPIVLPIQFGQPAEISASIERGKDTVMEVPPSYQPPQKDYTIYWVLALLAAVLAAILATYFLTAAAARYAPAYVGPPSGENVCDGTKPKEGAGFDNTACKAEDLTVLVDEQSGADVSSPFIGTLETTYAPITKAYWKAGMCPVNVHWHLGAEHRSAGQYDEEGKGPGKARRAGDARLGLRCKKYDAGNSMFTTEYAWKHCKDMHVGETYEVHWPHSAGGACGTVNQYQTPFYDGVFCNGGDLALSDTGFNIGVQAQVFTIVNDEKYYYPDLIKGMIVDGEKGEDMVFYTGSTTGITRNNDMCSKYTPITWQVDRTCHVISASTFDKMCADMKAQRDDMSDDLHPHGAREVVLKEYTANNMKAGSLSGGRASFP